MLDGIMNRRRVRRFAQRPVEEETVVQLLRAAMQAPSAKNERPWEFVVVKDREKLRRLSLVSPYAKAMEHAPLGIVVLCNRERFPNGDDTFWQQDMSAATHALLLAAAALGLGATWLGIAPIEERMVSAAEVLSLPAHIIPFAMLPIGYAQQEKPPEPRFERERVSFDTYQQNT